MKSILILISFLLSLSVYAQVDETNGLESSKGEAPKTSETSSSSTEEKAKIMGDDLDLDREFYSTYFLIDPLDYKKEQENNQKERVEENLLFHLRNEIRKRDKRNEHVLRDLNLSTMRYQKVNEDSPWLKKIRADILGNLSITEYIYIAKYKSYLCLIIFEMDPRRFKKCPTRDIELLFARDKLYPKEEIESK
ncbi:MAG: hypothetical protein H7A25_21720 [Leptospiraceae bacterium]|nr:hypothetical protein [Leptospiraceae bacterium]MCP5502532.1 hypothetical protein [Leptospiraceae bacterium]